MTSLQQHVARRPAEAVGHLPRALDAVGLLQRRLHARVEVEAERRERRADARGGLAHLGERPLDGDRVGLAEQVAVQRREGGVAGRPQPLGIAATPRISKATA